MKTTTMTCLTFILLTIMWPLVSLGLMFPLPPNGSDIVGSTSTITITADQDLHELVRHYDIGYDELLNANPTLDPNHRRANQTIILPTMYILPPGPRQGIVINLPEKRLYYFPADQNVVLTFPIGIGQLGWATPMANTLVSEKIKDPVWTVPYTLHVRLKKLGIYLPRKIVPGPDDPLGNYALRLTLPGYLIHGTDDPASIGSRASSGCLRLFPEDIENLFNHVSVGTPVRIMNDAYKMGWNGTNLYLQAYPSLTDANDAASPELTSLSGQSSSNGAPAFVLTKALSFNESIKLVEQNPGVTINWLAAYKARSARRGVPEPIGTAISH